MLLVFPAAVHGESAPAKPDIVVFLVDDTGVIDASVPFLTDETFLTEALTIEAKARVTDAVQAGKPFYVYMSHYAVHAPFHSAASRARTTKAACACHL